MWHGWLTFPRETRLITKHNLFWQADCSWHCLEEERLMSIAKITGQGLSAIALSVALLWGCVIGERVAARRAFSERAKVLREISRMQRRQRTQPVSEPVPFVPHRARVAAG
jgi:hypothetical protein